MQFYDANEVKEVVLNEINALFHEKYLYSVKVIAVVKALGNYLSACIKNES